MKKDRTQELLEAFLNDEKIVSLNAPIEALGPEMSENAIKILKKTGVITVGQFQSMPIEQIYVLNYRTRKHKEILRHWRDIQDGQS